MNNISLRIICVFLLTALLCGAVPTYADGEDKALSGLLGVSVTEEGALEAKVYISDDFVGEYGACGVYLFEFAPSEALSAINDKAPVGELVATAGQSTLTVKTGELAPARRYSRFVLAREADAEYIPFSAEKYIDNPQAFAENTAALPAADGIGGTVYTDGVTVTESRYSHGVVQVYLEELFADTADGAVRYEREGEVYYIDKDVLTTLDSRVKTLSEVGVAVYLQILLGAPDETVSDLARSLYADPGAEAKHYAPDTASGEGVRLYTSLMEFLAGRYTASSGEYGFAGRFILGNNADMASTEYAGGGAEYGEYIESLSRTLRITDTALRSTYSGAKLYISLSGVLLDAADGDYGAKEVLDDLCTRLWDVPFGIYLDISRMNTAQGEGPYVDINGISDFAASLQAGNMLCGGYVRDAVAAYNVDCGEDADRQAAELLCACYNVLTTDGISALIYNLPKDTDGTSAGIINGAGIPKRAYTALCEVRQMGDADYADRIRYLVSEEELAQLSGGNFADLFVPRTHLPMVSEDLPGEDSAEYIADFADGLAYNFVSSAATESAVHAILPDEGIVFAMTGKADRAGMYRAFDSYSLEDADLLVLSVMAKTEDERANLTVTLDGTADGEAAVLYGTAALESGLWQQVAFRLPAGFTVSEMRVDAISEGGAPLTLYAESILTYALTPDSSELAVRIVLWVLVIALGVFLVLWIYYSFMRAHKRPAPAKNKYKYQRRNAPAQVRTEREKLRKSESTPPAPEKPAVQSAEKKKVPEMPKTQPKTFVVPPKQSAPAKRATMDLGIEPTVAGEDTGIDTTGSGQA